MDGSLPGSSVQGIFQARILEQVAISIHLILSRGFSGGSVVKNLPAMIPGLGRSPGGGNTHSSVLACRIPWTEEPGGLQFMGLQKSQSDTT